MTKEYKKVCATRRRHLLAATALVPLTWLSAGPALAQTAPSAATSDASDQPAASDIVVTGSRLGAGFTAPTPVTSVGQAQIQQRAIVAVAELLQEVPQLRINQNIGKSSEPVGQSTADLRGLGPARTLVLLDGRRIAATSTFGGIDTNIFPVSLISNVDIVTGGASAAYGSDAVAGVVNFSLNKTLEGFKADLSYAQSKYNDFRRPVISAAIGRSFFDNRLHVEIAGDFYRNSGQTAQGTRPWGNKQTSLVANPAFIQNGLPKNFEADGARFANMTFGGLIVVPSNSPLRGIQFGPGGTPIPFRYGQFIYGTTYAVGGDGDTIANDGNILPLIKRYSGYGRASYDITDNVSMWADVLYSRVTVFSDLANNYDLPTITKVYTATNSNNGAETVAGGLVIQRDNAYLPASIRAIMVANNINTFNYGRSVIEDGYSQNNSIARALRYAGGFEGHFGDGWKWDFSAQRSRNYFRQESPNNRITARWVAGVDAVYFNPTTNTIFNFAGGATTPPAGAVLSCRVNVDTNPNNDQPGCVPINVFGPNTVSAAAQAWYRGTSFYYTFQHQDVYAANISGTPFSTWAGKVSVAAGGEYRRESIHGSNDPISATSGWRSVNQSAVNGALNVKEVYGEIAVPLAKDWTLAQDVELNGAVRYTDYSTSGGVTTYKVGLNYSPVADIRFRGTYSQDIRAANVNELFSGRNQVITPLTDPRTGNSANVTQLTGGNPNLKPEKAKTRALGIVLQPSFLPGFHASVDYYSIKIKDAIAVLSAQLVINSCLRDNIAAFCQFVNFTPTALTGYTGTLVNSAQLKTSGIDFEAQYRFPLSVFGRTGSLTLRGLANHVRTLKSTNSGVVVETAGVVGAPDAGGGTPRWRANFDVTYATGPVRAGVNIRYVGGGKFNSTYVEGVDLPSDQYNISARTYVNLSAAYKVTPKIEIYGKADNIFDIRPPKNANNIVAVTIANSQFYDKIGPYFAGGVRVAF